MRILQQEGITSSQRSMSRPTECVPEIIELAKAYINSCEDTETTVKIPTIEGLALYLQISRKTLYNWEDSNEEFLHIMEELRHKQADRLLNNGLSGRYNSTISKVILTKHGYREGIEQTGKEGTPLIPEKDLSDEDKALLSVIKEHERNSSTKTGSTE